MHSETPDPNTPDSQPEDPSSEPEPASEPTS